MPIHHDRCDVRLVSPLSENANCYRVVNGDAAADRADLIEATAMTFRSRSQSVGDTAAGTSCWQHVLVL